MGLTAMIALRHLRARARSTLLTSAGVALGVTVMSVMSSLLLGLQSQFINNIIATTPTVLVEGYRVGEINRRISVPQQGSTIVSLSRRPPPERERKITNYPLLISRIEQIPGVQAAAPALTGQVLLRYGTRARTAALTGIIPAQQARTVEWTPRLRQQRADLPTTTDGAVVGIELAKNLGLPPGARVTLIAGPGQQQRMRVIALYQSGIRPIDESAVFVNLRLAQSLLGYPSQVGEIDVRVKDVNQAPATAIKIRSVTGLRARSWQEIDANFFSIFRLQNTVTSSMIAFIVVIAGFGITNGLITLILEKQRDIGILKAIGATNSTIVAIFLLEGLLMGIIGALIGMALSGEGIRYLAHQPLRGQGQLTTATTFTMLRVPGIYLIPALVAVVVSIVASLLPVRRAAQYDPVTIIRSAK